jgi:hypothetical protein
MSEHADRPLRLQVRLSLALGFSESDRDTDPTLFCSQGAQVVHLGVKQISAAAASQLSAVVFFGDPDDGQALQNIAANKDDTYCFSTDLICDGLPIVLPAHLSYALDAVPAAQFVAGLVHV